MTLDASRYPETAAHITDAIAAGQPSVVHVARTQADANRAAALRGIPTRSGMDRDEWPMSFTDEGGRGADIRYVTPKDNQGAGSSIAGQMGSYCDGQAFRVAIK